MPKAFVIVGTTRLAALILKGGGSNRKAFPHFVRSSLFLFLRFGNKFPRFKTKKALIYIKAFLFVGTTRFELATPSTPC